MRRTSSCSIPRRRRSLSGASSLRFVIFLLFALLVARSKAFLELLHHHRIIPQFGSQVVVEYSFRRLPKTAVSVSQPTTRDNNNDEQQLVAVAALSSSSSSKTNDLNDEISRLCEHGAFDAALALLDQAEVAAAQQLLANGHQHPNAETYTRLLTAMSAAAAADDDVDDTDRVVRRVEDVFARMKRHLGTTTTIAANMPPPITRVAYNAVILAWSKSYARQAGDRCEALLAELWSLYNSTSTSSNSSNSNNTTTTTKALYCPSLSTYVSTLTALARSQGGKRAAERAEALLEDMERVSREDHHPSLKPTTTCVNIVL